MFNQAPVFLDGQKILGLGQEKLGECAKTGADFQHFIIWLDVSSLDDAAQHILVVQQILSKRLREPDGLLIECLPDVCAIHVSAE